MISPLWKEHNGTLGKSIFWDPKYTLPLYLMAAWNIISEIWFCKGVLLWPLSHEVEKWTSKFGGGELLCNKPLQCSPLYCGSPRCNHPIYSAEAMTSQKTCFKLVFCISSFLIPCISRAWWKTSTAQIWWESVHGGPRYGRMNTKLAPLKSL